MSETEKEGANTKTEGADVRNVIIRLLCLSSGSAFKLCVVPRQTSVISCTQAGRQCKLTRRQGISDVA